MGSIYSRFKEITENHRDEVAIIENDNSFTFGDLSDMIDTISGKIPKDAKSVGVVLSHNAKMIASLFAILKVGARYIPAEPDFPTGRIKYMMEESCVDFIITQEEFCDRVKSFKLKFIDNLLDNSIDNDKPLPESLDLSVDSKTPAYVLYTSGTTGRPKGVCVSNANVCHYARAFANEFHPGPGDVMLQYSVCSFDIFVEEVFASLLNGAAIAIPDVKDKANISALLDFVRHNKVTIISGFPYLLAELNHEDNIPDSLRLLISGGDVLRDIYIRNLLPKIDVYNTYGPSETTVCATYFRCNGVSPLSDGTYPIGKPVLGAKIEILDDDCKPVAPGEIGEICIMGDGVSSGYIGHHEKENEAFRILPDGGVVYHSGDVGYLMSDGNIAFLHRKDTQIMIYGKRVEVAEVEARLYQCRGIRQALVRAFTDESGLSYMIAYIVPASKNLKISSIKKELSEHLTPFMIPEFFVKMMNIPLNSNGKPDISLLPVIMKEGYGGEY